MKKNAQSIFDTLLTLMPELKQNTVFGKNTIDPLAAKALFTVWKTGKTVNDKTYKRPTTLSIYDIEKMKKAGLIINVGENIEVTKKGADVIKVMILGDDRSIFEKTPVDIIDYSTALSNTKNVKTAKQRKVASFWQKVEDNYEKDNNNL